MTRPESGFSLDSALGDSESKCSDNESFKSFDFADRQKYENSTAQED